MTCNDASLLIIISLIALGVFAIIWNEIHHLFTIAGYIKQGIDLVLSIIGFCLYFRKRSLLTIWVYFQIVVIILEVTGILLWVFLVGHNLIMIISLVTMIMSIILRICLFVAVFRTPSHRQTSYIIGYGTVNDY
jgi:hypothetical protein